MNDEYLQMAAEAIEHQAAENPDIGIPVDPEVADYMGAFEERAVNLEDFDPLDEEEEL